MLNIILTNQFFDSLSLLQKDLSFLCLRRLSKREKEFILNNHIQRFYLPQLSSEEQKEYFKEFNQFWNQVVSEKDKRHPFWSNVVSSKMQEWEQSVGYLSLILFSLLKLSNKKNISLIVIYTCWQEKELWKQWASEHEWNLSIVPPQGKFVGEKFKQELKNLFMYARRTYVVLRKKFFAPRLKKELFGNFKSKKILLISLFYPWSLQGDQYQDPFFGKFHQYLKKKKIDCVYLSDNLDFPNNYSAQALKSVKEVPLIVPFSILSWWNIFVILGRVYFRRIFYHKSYFMGCDFSLLLHWYSRRWINDFTLNAEIFYEAVNRLSSDVVFDQMIYIYEGNAFERACVQAFYKKNGPEIVGYSHAVVYPLNLKLFMTQQELSFRPEPQRYIGSGKTMASLLKQVCLPLTDKIEEGCSMRKIPVFDKEIKSCTYKEKSVLVALDGVWTCIYFLDWLMEHAHVFKNRQVLIRTHPNIPISIVLSQCVHALPDFFEISQSSLEQDLQQCFCVIYRQTSIGLQALLNFIPVIHLSVDVPLFADPLEGKQYGKWIAHSAQELARALEDIQNENKKSEKIPFEKNLLNEYFCSPTPQRLDKFIHI